MESFFERCPDRRRAAMDVSAGDKIFRCRSSTFYVWMFHEGYLHFLPHVRVSQVSLWRLAAALGLVRATATMQVCATISGAELHSYFHSEGYAASLQAGGQRKTLLYCFGFGDFDFDVSTPAFRDASAAAPMGAMAQQRSPATPDSPGPATPDSPGISCRSYLSAYAQEFVK